MSALNKVMEYLGLVDGPEGATEEVKPKPVVREERVKALPTTTSTNGVTVIGGRANVEAEPVLDLESSYNIVTLHPRSYSDARQMAEHYRQGNPVIINLNGGIAAPKPSCFCSKYALNFASKFAALKSLS